MNLTYYLQKAAVSMMSRVLAPQLLKARPDLKPPRREPDLGAIRNSLAAASPSLDVRQYHVARKKYEEWVLAAHYPWDSYLKNREEKFLEHFISWDLIELPVGGTLVDIASCRSRFPNIVRSLGATAIAQDWSYPVGLHGSRLGGNAASMDLPNASVDGMTLHCSFEHFEGDNDTAFVREAARVLKPGGRVVIVPLYLHDRYLIETDPFFMRQPLDLRHDQEAVTVASFGYANRHGRHYDVLSLVKKVLEPARVAGLSATIFDIDRAELSSSTYANFALVLAKPHLKCQLAMDQTPV